jgi:ABC-type transporter Mla MlaB component
MIRIMTATEPKLNTITVDGELAGEYVDAVETCATQAIAQQRLTHLFLRDVSSIDESGRALLARLAAKGVACVPQEFTVPTSLHKSVNPLLRLLMLRASLYVSGRSLKGPTERVACYCRGAVKAA